MQDHLIFDDRPPCLNKVHYRKDIILDLYSAYNRMDYQSRIPADRGTYLLAVIPCWKIFS